MVDKSNESNKKYQWQKGHKGMEVNGVPISILLFTCVYWHLKFQQETDSYFIFSYFIGQCNNHDYLQKSWGIKILLCPQKKETRAYKLKIINEYS